MPELSESFDVFLSTSFSSKVNYDTGAVDSEYCDYLKGILSDIRSLGMTAFCSIEYEGWKISDEPPEVGVEVDQKAIEVSKKLLALIGSEKSDGRSDETGFARGREIPVYLMLEPAVTGLSYYYQGLVECGRAKLISTVNELTND